jgi:hypothetical protein
MWFKTEEYFTLSCEPYLKKKLDSYSLMSPTLTQEALSIEVGYQLTTLLVFTKSVLGKE